MCVYVCVCISIFAREKLRDSESTGETDGRCEERMLSAAVSYSLSAV